MNKQEVMKKINEIERNFKLKSQKKERSLWDILCSLHSIPELREDLTLESLPLLPFPEKKDGELFLSIFLSTEKNNQQLFRPWGIVIIDWPGIKFVKIEKIASFWTGDLFLNRSCLCNKAFADMIQECFEKDEKLPLPPLLLLKEYIKIRRAF